MVVLIPQGLDFYSDLIFRIQLVGAKKYIFQVWLMIAHQKIQRLHQEYLNKIKLKTVQILLKININLDTQSIHSVFVVDYLC